MPIKAPAKLGPAGRKVWRDITELFDLGPHELRILEDAVREVDLIERLELALQDAALVVAGSMGQPTASPLVTEIRQHRVVLARLFAGLKLPEAQAPQGMTSATARDLAMKRWGRGA